MISTFTIRWGIFLPAFLFICFVSPFKAEWVLFAMRVRWGELHGESTSPVCSHKVRVCFNNNCNADKTGKTWYLQVVIILDLSLAFFLRHTEKCMNTILLSFHDVWGAQRKQILRCFWSIRSRYQTTLLISSYSSFYLIFKFNKWYLFGWSKHCILIIIYASINEGTHTVAYLTLSFSWLWFQEVCYTKRI